MAETKPTAEEKKAERARENLARLNKIVDAAAQLVQGWHGSGFYDRQDAAAALRLHEALAAYESGEKP